MATSLSRARTQESPWEKHCMAVKKCHKKEEKKKCNHSFLDERKSMKMATM